MMSKTLLTEQLNRKETIQANAQAHLQKLTADLNLINSLVAGPITKQMCDVRDQLNQLADEIYKIKSLIENFDAPVMTIKDTRGGFDF